MERVVAPAARKSQPVQQARTAPARATPPSAARRDRQSRGLAGPPPQRISAARAASPIAGISSPTSVVVGDVRRRWLADPAQYDQIFDGIADLARQARSILTNADSAALGAAMIAAHTVGGISYATLAAAFCPATLTILPRPDAVRVYASRLAEFEAFEAAAILNV